MVAFIQEIQARLEKALRELNACQDTLQTTQDQLANERGKFAQLQFAQVQAMMTTAGIKLQHCSDSCKHSCFAC